MLFVNSEEYGILSEIRKTISHYERIVVGWIRLKFSEKEIFQLCSLPIMVGLLGVRLGMTVQESFSLEKALYKFKSLIMYTYVFMYICIHFYIIYINILNIYILPTTTSFVLLQNCQKVISFYIDSASVSRHETHIMVKYQRFTGNLI